MTSARSVCMNVSRVSGAGLCGVGSITQAEKKVVFDLFDISERG